MGNGKSAGDKSASKTPVQELTEDEIELLLANTNLDRFKIIEWHEGFLRDCPNGKLNKKKFEETYKQLYPDGHPEKYSQYVFDVFDADNNDAIDFAEFLLVISALSDRDLNKRLHLAFKIIDIDDNNKIDGKELEKIVSAIYDLKGVPKDQRVGDNSAKSVADSVFKKLDRDDSKFLTEEEFVEGCLQDSKLVALLLPP